MCIPLHHKSFLCTYPFALCLPLSLFLWHAFCFADFHTAHAHLQSSSFYKYDKSAQKLRTSNVSASITRLFFHLLFVWTSTKAKYTRRDWKKTKCTHQRNTVGTKRAKVWGVCVLDGLDCFDYEILVPIRFNFDRAKISSRCFFSHCSIQFRIHTNTGNKYTQSHIAAYTHMHVSKTEEQIGDKRHTDTRIEICVRADRSDGTWVCVCTIYR